MQLARDDSPLGVRKEEARVEVAEVGGELGGPEGGEQLGPGTGDAKAQSAAPGDAVTTPFRGPVPDLSPKAHRVFTRLIWWSM